MAVKLSPSLITAWLSCPHYLNLKIEGSTSQKPSDSKASVKPDPKSVDVVAPVSLATILKERGLQHETQTLASLKASGADVFECEVDRTNLNERAVSYLAEGALGHEVVYQMPFVHEGMRGIADFVIREEDGHLPVDTKLARHDAKPGHVLQLCFYADAVGAATGKRPTHIEIWLGGLDDNGKHKKERHRLSDVDAYWRRMKGAIKEAITHPIVTSPEPCDHCAFCEFAPRCESEWRSNDAVHFVSGVSRRDREKLDAAGVHTRGQLANFTGSVSSMDPDRLIKIQDQAKLQVAACAISSDVPESVIDSTMPIHLLPLGGDVSLPVGLEALPKPNKGDLFLDYEGHPFWKVEEGLIFLFGLLYKDGLKWKYDGWWAHSKGDEQLQATALVNWIADRLEKYPKMHVYHYNHTERSTLASLVSANQHDVGIQQLFDALREQNVFVDLYQIVKQTLQVGVESYGLKKIEKVAGYLRPTDDSVSGGADAVASYEGWMRASDKALADQLLIEIRDYNEQDVLATKHVRDWLVSLRKQAGVRKWPKFAFDDQLKPIDPVEQTLLQFPIGSSEHLLGDVLGYWRRENVAKKVKRRTEMERNADALRDDEKAIGGIQLVRHFQETDASGKIGNFIEIRFPKQKLSTKFETGADVEIMAIDGSRRHTKVIQITATGAVIVDPPMSDPDNGTVTFPARLGIHSMMLGELFINAINKEKQLMALANTWATTGAERSKLSNSLLNRVGPIAPSGGFSSDMATLVSVVSSLNGEVLAVQGPPGTGKTYTAAKLIEALLVTKSNLRIGVCSTNNDAVDNVLKEILKSLPPEYVNSLNRIGKDNEAVGLIKGKPAKEELARQVQFGTVFGLCKAGVDGTYFDVIFADEAGQMSLADALAVSHSARSMVLLGDPLQLPQVSQASHQFGSGESVLQHFLGDEVTISSQRGLFLDVSRRMHPSICSFISDWQYEGRLHAESSCATLSTSVDSLTPGGTGLRVKLMNHVGNTTESSEEVLEVVSIITNLIGKTWTNNSGETKTIGVEDVLVVVPFNDQRIAIDEALNSQSLTQGVQVGTVDKFQGREAAVVIFSMAASSVDDLERGADFLFDSHRLNVAISRAKCLAYVVCNEPLLTSRARSVDQMKLFSGLCLFTENAIEI